MSDYSYYRPQRSWAKVIFSQVCVKNSVHRGGEGVCLSACWDTPPAQEQTPPGSRHPPCLGSDTPPEQTPPCLSITSPLGSRLPAGSRHHPSGADTPLGADTPHLEQTSPHSRHPSPEQTPSHREQILPQEAPREQTPPQETDCSIRSTSGRYASYWNAFLCSNLFSNFRIT